MSAFVAYYRVSTQGQGRSGLGLEAQRSAVATQVALRGGRLVAEFEEIESGGRNDRPVLAKALAACRAHRAVLIIAKLDRLARHARFLLTIVEGTGEAGVLFCDLPTVPIGPVGKFLITQMAAVAELEAGPPSHEVEGPKIISRRSSLCAEAGGDGRNREGTEGQSRIPWVIRGSAKGCSG